MSTPSLPIRWDLSQIYPSFDSSEFWADYQKLASILEDLEAFCHRSGIGPRRITPEHSRGEPVQASAPAPAAESETAQAETIGGFVERANQALLLFRSLSTFLSLHVAVDSYNTGARRRLSELEQVGVHLQRINVSFQTWLGKRSETLPALEALDGRVKEHAFFLREAAEQARYLMPESEEALAAELNLSGGSAWGKLQGTVVSQLSVPFKRGGKVVNLPMTALINLHADPDAQVRRRAYEAELEAWKSVREPLAAAMNGVKGAAHTLNQRRGRMDDLHQSLDQARIDRHTLEAMMGAMRDFFPVFRKYLRRKAVRLGWEGGPVGAGRGGPVGAGRGGLPWWDVFAPVGKLERKYSMEGARDFIVTQFAGFSSELAEFAAAAFERGWIDAEPRPGKRAGAFCSAIMPREESRVFSNFDGSLDQVFTLAHELGHAFHNSCMKDLPPLLRTSPMTLAETASIFCETIATNAALQGAASPEEELGILETSLIGDCQVIVDISSRFLFEQEVFERRAKAELSADELCEIMTRAQQTTYGDGLDSRYLHPYMWTWKPHYYSAGLHFYNFPYAFGLLFGLGLYAIYQQRGESFIPEYKALLRSTGQGRADELARRFGIDLRAPAFWQASLKIIEERIERYCTL